MDNRENTAPHSVSQESSQDSYKRIEARDQLVILRGQLTLLRMRAEHGIGVSLESIARAEDLARALELFDVAA